MGNLDGAVVGWRSTPRAVWLAGAQYRGEGCGRRWGHDWTNLVSSYRYPFLRRSQAHGSIWGLNRLLHYYFRRQRNAEGMSFRSGSVLGSPANRLETHLRKLLAEQKKQVDAIKKATNYDSTRKLIERYDEGQSQQQFGMPLAHPSGSNPSTPVRAGKGSAQNTPASQRAGAPSPQLQGATGSPRAPGHLAGVAGTPGCTCSCLTYPWCRLLSRLSTSNKPMLIHSRPRYSHAPPRRSSTRTGRRSSHANASDPAGPANARETVVRSCGRLDTR
jgi:hypothetical protein